MWFSHNSRCTRICKQYLANVGGRNSTFYSASQTWLLFHPVENTVCFVSNGWGCADSSDTRILIFKIDCPPPIHIGIVKTCTNFNNIALNGFVPEPLSPNVLLPIDNTGSQGGNGDYYLKMQHQPDRHRDIGRRSIWWQMVLRYFLLRFFVCLDDGGTGVNINPKIHNHERESGIQFSVIRCSESGKWLA